MPTPITLAKRQQIVELHQRGDSLKKIAQRLRMSFWTVRALWRRARKQPDHAYQTDYARCGPKQARAERRLYLAAMLLKRRHPAWGAGLVLVLLAERWPKLALPHRRTLQRWWQKAGLTRRRSRLPPQQTARAQQVHQVWQMDATSHLRLADESSASWLTLSDECSGAVLEAVAFPPLRLGASPASGRPGSVAYDLSKMGLATALARR